MAYEVDGKTVEIDANGYLVNQGDWTENVAEHIAGIEGVTLTEKHWDLIKYLREEYFNSGGSQPNTRSIVKAMSEKWGTKASQKDVYNLFPKDPSKQGGRIAGLPESRRKGGY